MAGGITLKVGRAAAPAWLSMTIHVTMCWFTVIAAPAFLATVPLTRRSWVLAGGIIYTVGALVFATTWPRLGSGIFGAQALWQLLVIAGSACNVWAVARYLTPLA